jgi:Fic-DOC domain mobile mystery protein B
VGLLGPEPAGATPLTPDDLEGLRPKHVSTRSELDEWEAQNILAARRSLARRRPREILDDAFVRKLHKLMFCDTWRWAGTWRDRESNIGEEPRRIAVAVRKLCDDYRFQRDHTLYSPDELAVRFHRDLVWIHPFRNGNGRHARLMADLLVESLGEPAYTWGGGDLIDAGDVRTAYLQALRQADRNDHEPLLAFARS